MGVWQGLKYRLALSKLMKLKIVRIMGGSSVNNELLQHMLMGHTGKIELKTKSRFICQ